jgi:hypothetical protein
MFLWEQVERFDRPLIKRATTEELKNDLALPSPWPETRQARRRDERAVNVRKI